jgi:hypothetical protein
MKPFRAEPTKEFRKKKAAPRELVPMIPDIQSLSDSNERSIL